MISTSIRRAAAKKLRANTTPHERTLWRALKELPVEGTHFRRQTPIGPYVVDFFCPAKHLIIELDGGHHTTTKLPSATAKGSFGLNRRDIVLSASGIPRSPAI
jgi:very-short-patch-repair endonuclease